MPTFAQKPAAPRQTTSATPVVPGRASLGREVPRLSPGSVKTSSSRPGHDFSRIPIQRKLEVGSTSDPLEHEADRVADQMMRKAAAPRISSAGAASGGSPVAAPPLVHEVLDSPGQPLAPATRALFEPKFAHDLSSIRVHADDRAAESAHAINARAYTVGDNIVFGEQRYAPETADGNRLLAHELTHSIQQSAGTAGSPHARVMRHPDPATPTARTPHPSVMQDIGKKFDQLYAKLSPEARFRLNRNSTIAIGLATDETDTAANSPRFVYTTAGNASTKEIDAVADGLGLTRWTARPRAEGRGAVGAPGDAEQLLTEAADANGFDLWGAGVNRRICADCALHVKDAEITVQVFPDVAFRKGGSLYNYTPAPAAKNPKNAPPSGADADKQDEGVVTPPAKTTPPPGGTAPPKGQGGTTKPGGEPGNEVEGGGTTPVPKPPVAVPPTGRVSQTAIQIGVGVASLGLSALAAYLKARVDQKMAQRQIDALLAAAKKYINANPDKAVEKMMIRPDATLYARVNLDSAVITSFGVNGLSPEPSSTDSSPIIDLASIDYSYIPLDASAAASFPRFIPGGREYTLVTTITIDIPLITPSVEDLIAHAKSHNLPLHRLLDHALHMAEISGIKIEIAINDELAARARRRVLGQPEPPNAPPILERDDVKKAQKETSYWRAIADDLQKWVKAHP